MCGSRSGSECLAAAVAVAQTTYELVHAFRNSCEPAGASRPEAPDLASQSGLILANDGYLYGTTYWGGSSGVGTIFRIDPSGGLTTVHSFAYADGANPAAALVQADDGNLYGTTTRGGTKGFGTVFRMDSSGAVQRLHSFLALEGADPRAALIQAYDGSLYGVTKAGGAPGGTGPGTLFKIDLDGTFTKLHTSTEIATARSRSADSFRRQTGISTARRSREVRTIWAPSSESTWRRIASSRSTYSTDRMARRPRAGLIQATDGNLYGTATARAAPSTSSTRRAS